MNKLRIIIVEDEEDLLNVLVEILLRLGLDVRGVSDGTSLDLALADYPADIVVLDLNLPGEDGVDIALRLRQKHHCGIIMTSSRAMVNERVKGFESGADLYFVKPINPIELHAALLNLGRRLKQTDSPVKAPWCYESSASVLRTPNGVSINLTANECTAIKLLFAAPGETISTISLLYALGYPDDQYGLQRLKTLFSRLRSKIHDLDPESELPVRARHSQGYSYLAESSQ
ncbi:MAG: response regulator transcription factor [Desulfuromonadaceae bacterium]|nr:response regulator transcription factor [Desulfuromonadaceae bacterium]MDD2855316.1 response regulator transcription factor [Desulfuromonadaceae bacterium]